MSAARDDSSLMVISRFSATARESRSKPNGRSASAGGFHPVRRLQRQVVVVEQIQAAGLGADVLGRQVEHRGIQVVQLENGQPLRDPMERGEGDLLAHDALPQLLIRHLQHSVRLRNAHRLLALLGHRLAQPSDMLPIRIDSIAGEHRRREKEEDGVSIMPHQDRRDQRGDDALGRSVSNCHVDNRQQIRMRRCPRKRRIVAMPQPDDGHQAEDQEGLGKEP